MAGMGKISIKGADGQLFDFHVGTKYAKTIDRFFFAVEYMEVVEEPVVTVNRDHKCFMAWKAKNRKTGEINSYGVTLTYMGNVPRIYSMTSEKVRRHLKAVRDCRKEAERARKQKGIVRTWTVLKLERRQNHTLVLVNVKTGKQRILVRNNQLLIEDKDIDFADIFRGVLIGKDEQRKKALEQKNVEYGIELVEHDAEGYGMLKWIYHKETYYFDSDDFVGTDFYPAVYCLVNSELEFIVPFRQTHDFEYMKKLIK